ncbi:MAG: diaminopimelate decarboxylase [Rhodobacteraceae bacterium]|nr:diaminopimelate decarboxylase [Paracoccaceae bacterium]
MDDFRYHNGQLYAEDLPIATIAQSVGTPFYCYSTATLTRHFAMLEQALAGLDPLICYSVKAASNQAILKTLAGLGAGMDVVSGGEYARAIAAGVPPDRIVFSGVGKTPAEIHTALAGGIGQFNVESEPELQIIDQTAQALGTVAPIAIRVNPDVDAGTHAKITTGKADNKFGIPLDQAPALYAHAARLLGVRVMGIDMHIGSQITQLDPYRRAYGKLAVLTRRLRAEGHSISRLDLGGGLGIAYKGGANVLPPLPAAYGALVRQLLGHLGCEIVIEPGRILVGNAGLMVSRVIYAKAGAARDFLIVDAAMNDLLRPAMYESYHDIVAVAQPKPGIAQKPYDIVGPVCETGDTFARARAMPPLAAGDLVAFRSAGAYGAVMASEYNSRPLIPEVLVKGTDFAVIRERPALEAMIKRDRIPPWL